MLIKKKKKRGGGGGGGGLHTIVYSEVLYLFIN